MDLNWLMPRALRRAVLRFQIDQLTANLEIVEEQMAQCHAKLASGIEWTDKALVERRRLRAELALLEPPQKLVDEALAGRANELGRPR